MRDKVLLSSVTLAALAGLLVPTPAYAYIGPGLGAGAIAAVLAVLGSIFLAIFAVVYYPIRRLIRKRRNRGALEGQGGPAE
jgi:hypothetical protein